MRVLQLRQRKPPGSVLRGLDPSAQLIKKVPYAAIQCILHRRAKALGLDLPLPGELARAYPQTPDVHLGGAA